MNQNQPNKKTQPTKTQKYFSWSSRRHIVPTFFLLCLTILPPFKIKWSFSILAVLRAFCLLDPGFKMEVTMVKTWNSLLNYVCLLIHLFVYIHNQQCQTRKEGSIMKRHNFHLHLQLLKKISLSSCLKNKC